MRGSWVYHQTCHDGVTNDFICNLPHQVQLSKEAYITDVATQGRYGGNQYTKSYTLQYLDPDISPSTWRDVKVSKICRRQPECFLFTKHVCVTQHVESTRSCRSMEDHDPRVFEALRHRLRLGKAGKLRSHRKIVYDVFTWCTIVIVLLLFIPKSRQLGTWYWSKRSLLIHFFIIVSFVAPHVIIVFTFVKFAGDWRSENLCRKHWHEHSKEKCSPGGGIHESNSLLSQVVQRWYCAESGTLWIPSR